MKKVFKSIIAIILAVCSILLVACNNDSNIAQGPKNPDSDVKTHVIANTLHKVNVTESSKVFTRNGETDYSVVVDLADYYKATASSFIINHVMRATGAELKLVTPETALVDATDSYGRFISDSKYIVVGDKALFSAAGLSMPSDNIGLTGYYVKTKGNSVFIMANGDDGYQLGAIAFLNAVLGYDMLSDDCVIYEKSGDKLPDMDIIERPDYDYRQSPNKMDFDTAYGMGFSNESEIWIPVEGYKLHNSFKWLPMDKYKKDHPKWYSAEADISDPIGETSGQLCYTAHGDPVEYNLMINAAFESAKKAINDCTIPNARNLSLTIADNPGNCNCEACKKILSDYGCISASVIKFMNDLDDKVQEWLQEEARKTGEEVKEINLVFFAYYSTETPPVIKNSDGTFSPIDSSVVCNDHVGVYIAPIKAKYNVSFYNSDNESYADNIRGWAVCSKLVYLWLYQTNFNHYLYPMNNWDVIAENYRFGKENNSVFMYDEGQLNQPTTTHFTRLKDYIAAKTEFDLNANYNDIVDKYFKYYFREAATEMRAFFNELQAYMRYMEVKFSDRLSGGIRDTMASTDLWSQVQLEGWVNRINSAILAVDKYKTDTNVYNMLVRHIKIESIFPRFALCTLYEGKFDAETLYNMRKSLRDDCLALNIERSAEYNMVNTTFKSWGL